MSNFWKKIYRYKSVSSTNDLAKALARKGEPEGTIILSEAQTRGRGKWNRHWISPKGEGIYLSIILRPKISSKDAAQITLMTAVAIVKALRHYLRLQAQIKWPNDILIDGKKIAGILTEIEEERGKVKFVIVGIGLNTNSDSNKFPKDLRNCITSVKQEFSRRFSQERLINEVIKDMEFYYPMLNKGAFSIIREEWKRYSATLGKQVEVFYHGKKVFGQALGLAESGTLLLRKDNGVLEELSGGDIKII